MANALSAAGIPTIIVPDASIFALMPRITKVILGSHTVLANGGLFALSGSLSAALAAKAHSKPVVVTTGQFKFAPAWNLYHEFSAVDFQSPGAILGFDGDGGGGGLDGAESLDPYYEYIKPELINLFVTNEWVPGPSKGAKLKIQGRSLAFLHLSTHQGGLRRQRCGFIAKGSAGLPLAIIMHAVYHQSKTQKRKCEPRSSPDRTDCPRARP